MEATQTYFDCPRQNNDPRIITAWGIYKDFEKGWLLAHKTTRAGCTTALAAESLNRKERLLVVVPTNYIADKTIIEDSINYSDREQADIIHIPSNKECVYNKLLIEQFPALKHLPMLPLGDNCDNCQYLKECSVTKILRGYGRDGVALTYDKLAALMMAMYGKKNTKAQRVIENISDMDNIVLDEVHELQYGKSETLTIYDDLERKRHIDIAPFAPLAVDFPHLAQIIAKYAWIIKDLEAGCILQDLKSGIEGNDYWKKKLSIKYNNSKNTISHLEEYEKTKFFMSVYSDIIELTKQKEEHKISMKLILELCSMMHIVTTDTIILHGIKDAKSTKIAMVSINSFYTSMLRSFIMSMQNKTKRIMLTSATICSHEYDDYFMMDTKPKNILFGPSGDPMNTNARMLIISDSKKLGTVGKNSFYWHKEDVFNRIDEIIQAYGFDNCIVVCMNMREYLDVIKHLENKGYDKDKAKEHCSYYKAPNMMGVSSKYRVMIAVGIAEKPTNAFDAITDTKERSLELKEESVHCDTWQAWSRVKDPQSRENSLVFALGCNYRQCENIATWGFNRRVLIETGEDYQKKNVRVVCSNEAITKPSIEKSKNFYDMMDKANMHKPFINEYELSKGSYFNCKTEVKACKNLPINNIIGSILQGFTLILQCSKVDLIKTHLVNRFDTFAEQNHNGTKYSRVSGYLTDSLINNHLEGKYTIGAYSTSEHGTCKWICFDIDAHKKEDDTVEQLIEKEEKAENDLKNLCSFLDLHNLKYLIESSGSPHSYHIWILIHEVEIEKAHYFAKYIAKEAGFDGEVNPKQRTWNVKNQYGNLVKLPFALHRKHGVYSYIHGWDGETHEICVYDISKVEVPKKHRMQSRANTGNINIKLQGVRPCMQAALTKDLRNSEGNSMRVAVVREFYNFGMRDPSGLAKLFSNQSDYDYSISLYYVNKIIERNVGVWKRETLVDKCSPFLECETCNRFDCKGVI